MNSYDLILNDISFVTTSSKNDAKEKMEGLIKTILTFNKLGKVNSLRFSPSLFSTFLAENYNVSNWVFDSEVETELTSFFKTKASKTPLLIDEPVAESESYRHEFLFNDEKCEALGASYLLQLPALSLATDESWNHKKIAIQIEVLDEHSGELITSIEDIIHASIPSHAISHTTWIQQKLSSPLKKGIDLWKNREILFANLDFCVEVEKQLEKIIMPMHIEQIRIRLEALNEYNEDDWSKERLQIVLPLFTGESKSTRDNDDLMRMRKFHKSDGQELICEWHMKMKGFNLRLHFYADTALKKFTVGYIGEHLANPSCYLFKCLEGESEQETEDFEHQAFWRDGMNVFGQQCFELTEGGFDSLANRSAQSFQPG